MFVDFGGYTCKVRLQSYPVTDRIGIQLTSGNYPIATASVNIVDITDDQMEFFAQISESDPKKLTFIKDSRENEGILEALVAAKVVRDLGITVESGYIKVPLCEVLI